MNIGISIAFLLVVAIIAAILKLYGKFSFKRKVNQHEKWIKLNNEYNRELEADLFGKE